MTDEEYTAEFEQWKAAVCEPPHLADLIAAHGRYDKITPEAWDQWDADNERFQIIHRAGLKYLSDEAFLREVVTNGLNKIPPPTKPGVMP